MKMVILTLLKKFKNMYNYTSAVGTKNTTNGKQFISLTNLIYDEDDKLIAVFRK